MLEEGEQRESEELEEVADEADPVDEHGMDADAEMEDAEDAEDEEPEEEPEECSRQAHENCLLSKEEERRMVLASDWADVELEEDEWAPWNEMSAPGLQADTCLVCHRRA